MNLTLNETTMDQIVEEYDSLSFRESKWQNLTRRYGNVYNVREYRAIPKHRGCPYYLAKQVALNNVGKSFNMAFHYYCTLVDKQYQHEFIDLFNKYRYHWRYRNYGFSVDSNKNIVYIPYKRYIRKPIVYDINNNKIEFISFNNKYQRLFEDTRKKRNSLKRKRDKFLSEWKEWFYQEYFNADNDYKLELRKSYKSII